MQNNDKNYACKFEPFNDIKVCKAFLIKEYGLYRSVDKKKFSPRQIIHRPSVVSRYRSVSLSLS